LSFLINCPFILNIYIQIVLFISKSIIINYYNDKAVY